MDVVVQAIGGHLLTVQEYSGYYDASQYLLLHPFGTYGWNIDYKTHSNRKFSSCDYYSYILQIETGRLRWISTHQKDIRCDLYQGLQDCLIAGQNNAGIVSEEPTVLPSSFTGGRRDMYQHYLDAMVVVQKYGSPIFSLQ
ncbi:hypothetical protein LIER_40910 [Lithospermum erythrorhizon]|uniref:Helitron helicase-like domain-containing protein n=1 Tax=Lithospermum erythrorhizon TaxID=34254 RepID=A0AAV3R4J1_LITER